MNRRQFLMALAAAAVSTAAGPPATRPVRRRGFNLLELFAPQNARPFAEADFAAIAGWGFDFVRLPLSYWCWASVDRPTVVRDERPLRYVDQAVAWGKQYGVHVNLCLHRIAGFCVNPPKEPTDLWTDPAAQAAAVAQWTMLADRYRGEPASTVSFDLINEPGKVPAERYAAVVRQLVAAIRSIDADRLIVADGLMSGTVPVPSLMPLGIGQLTRGYGPMRVSHYKASWIHGNADWPAPTWPLTVKPGDVWDKARLHREQIVPWQRLADRGVYVHVGEWGAYNRTPYDVVLSWMRDNLELWRTAGWGWSLWNLTGPFGILDSHRAGATYEPFGGRQLDRRMLELLRAY